MNDWNPSVVAGIPLRRKPYLIILSASARARDSFDYGLIALGGSLSATLWLMRTREATIRQQRITILASSVSKLDNTCHYR